MDPLTQLEQQFSFAVETWLMAVTVGEQKQIDITNAGIEYAITRYEFEITR